MSNPLIDRWRQRGNLYLWRFDDQARNYPGWNFTADGEGCISLLELLAMIANDCRTANADILLSKPPVSIQALAGVGRGRLRAPRRFTLKVRSPESSPADFWQWSGTLHDLKLKIGRGKLAELFSAVKSVAQGVGDFNIGAANHKQHGFDFTNAAIWFW